MAALPITKAERVEFDELEFLTLEGVDQRGRKIIRVLGKQFPARFCKENLLAYLLQKLAFGDDGDDQDSAGFVVVYFHAAVQSAVNNPGLLTLRWLYEMLPMKRKLESIYFVHPGVTSRLLVSTIGWLLLSEGFSAKVKYVERIEFLWEYIDSEQLQVPDFAWECDDHLECLNYGSSDIKIMPHIGPPHCVSYI